MKAPLVLALFVALLLAPTVLAKGEPQANFRVDPWPARAGQPITFTSTVPDPDGNITNWTWTFEGVTGNAYGPVVQQTFPTSGDVLVQLVAQRQDGSLAFTGDYVGIAPAQPTSDFLPAWLYWAMPLLVASVLFVLAWIVLQRGQPAIYNLVFFLLYVASGLKSLTEAFAVLTPPGSAAHATILDVNLSIAFLYAPLFLWFVLVFPRPIVPWLTQGRRGAIVLLLSLPFFANLFAGWLPAATTINVLNAFSSLLAVGCLGLLVYHGWETDSNEERARIRYLAVTFGLLVFSTIVVSLLHFAQTYYDGLGATSTADAILRSTVVFALFVQPLLEIVGAMVMMYAILRYQLMGIQSLVVKVTRGAVVALAVPSVFVIVGNTIEEIFQNLVLGEIDFAFIIAGFISAVLMVPIQKFTAFALNKFLPALTVAEEAARRMEIYETQLRYSLLDGALNDHEIDILKKLAAEIKLLPQELERVVKSFPQANLGRLQAPAAAA